MRIVSLNKNPERYEFLSEMDYKNPNFHGHQTALCIGIKRLDGTWDEVYTSADTKEEKIKIANDMLNDKSLIILEDKITTFEDDRLVSKLVYYLPYYVADHSVYQPTINFDQISFADNTINNIKIEVLFVSERNCNRYITFTFDSKSSSLIDFIERLGNKIIDKAMDVKDDSFFIASEDTNEYVNGEIVLDFYDKSGQMYYESGNVNHFLNMVSSIRIIDIDTKIVKDKKDS